MSRAMQLGAIPGAAGAGSRPRVIIFDVNESLSDMSAMAHRFEDVGAPAHMAQTWFAGLLRDGFALTAVAASAPFATIAAESLRVGFHGLSLNRETEDAVAHIMAGFRGLQVHPDVPDGIRALSSLGIRLVSLSNGSASIAEALFERAGLRSLFEQVLSVDDAGSWKPAPGAYRYALQRSEVDPRDAMLVAVHPWDTDGAARVGMATAWLNRTDSRYPSYFTPPDLRPTSLPDLATLVA